jgi:energy-converting hydrogenase Eha subunit E
MSDYLAASTFGIRLKLPVELELLIMLTILPHLPASEAPLITTVTTVIVITVVVGTLLVRRLVFRNYLTAGSSSDAFNPTTFVIIVKLHLNLEALTDQHPLHLPGIGLSCILLAFFEDLSLLTFLGPCLKFSIVPSKTPASSNGY